MLTKKLPGLLLILTLILTVSASASPNQRRGSVSLPSADTQENISRMKEAVEEFRNIVHHRESSMNNSSGNVNTIRIVSLSPIVTENLFSLGLKNNIVGVDSLSDYFKPSAGITKVATVDTINYEELINLMPDVVIVWNRFYPDLESTVERLKLPAKVFRFTTERITDYYTAILDLGRITGTLGKASELKEQFAIRINKLRSQYHNYPSHSVIYILWDDPVYSVSENTWINDMIEICSGTNPLKKLDVAYPVIEKEYLLKLQPEIIINATVKKKHLNIPQPLQDRVRELKSVDGTHRISMNTLDSIEELCEIIHKDDKLYENPVLDE